MKRRAFSLPEILIVIAIIAVLAVIVTPIMVRAKRSAKATAAKANLRQLWAFTVLYQSDWGPGMEFGSRMDMRFWPDSYFLPTELPSGIRKSPCGQHPDANGGQPMGVDTWFVPFDDRQWIHHVNEKESMAVLWVDGNCTNHAESITSPGVLHDSLGVRLSGSIWTNRHYGHFMDLRNWKN